MYVFIIMENSLLINTGQREKETVVKKQSIVFTTDTVACFLCGESLLYRKCGLIHQML